MAKVCPLVLSFRVTLVFLSPYGFPGPRACSLDLLRFLLASHSALHDLPLMDGHFSRYFFGHFSPPYFRHLRLTIPPDRFTLCSTAMNEKRKKSQMTPLTHPPGDPWDLSPIYNGPHYTLLPNGSLKVHEVTREVDGHYFCSASNGFGSDVGKLIRLTVNGNDLCSFLCSLLAGLIFSYSSQVTPSKNFYWKILLTLYFRLDLVLLL